MFKGAMNVEQAWAAADPSFQWRKVLKNVAAREPGAPMTAGSSWPYRTRSRKRAAMSVRSMTNPTRNESIGA
jgi:hypothetical protein